MRRCAVELSAFSAQLPARGQAITELADSGRAEAALCAVSDWDTKMRITVEGINETTFKVTVANGTTTTHTVTVGQDYWRKLTGGSVPPAELVEKSFEFLLERESNTSILRTFELPVIQSYFPEYERTIGSMLK